MNFFIFFFFSGLCAQLIAMEKDIEKRNELSNQLWLTIMKQADARTLGILAQVSHHFNCLASEATLMGEKKRLFLHIVDVTAAEPNTIQALRQFLQRELSIMSQDNPLVNRLTSIAERLIQPEDLITLLDREERDRLLQASAADHPALVPMNSLLADIDELLLFMQIDELLHTEQNDRIGKFLHEAQKYYREFIEKLCSPSCDRARHIRRKAILSGERLFYPRTLLPDWLKAFGSTSPSFRISQKKAIELLSTTMLGSQKKRNDEGSHSVALLHGTYGSVHFKAVPEGAELLVGYEAAIFWLAKLLFNHGVTASSFLTVSDVEMLHAPERTQARAQLSLSQVNNGADDFMVRKPQHQQDFVAHRTGHYVQASAHVEGLSIKKFIEEVDAGRRSYDEIDVTSFSEHFILSLLTNPYDGNGGNYILSPSNGHFVIVGIDNDKSFAPVIIKKSGSGRYHLQYKTIVACLPLMNRQLSPEVIARILAIDEHVLFLKWLDILNVQASDYLAVSNLDPITKEAKRPVLPSGGSLSNEFLHTFDPTLLLEIPRKLQQIKQFLKHAYGATHWDLFKYMHPLVACFYQTIIEKNQGHPGKSFLEIYHENHRDLSIESVVSQTMGKLVAVLFPSSEYNERFESARTETVGKIAATFLRNMDLAALKNCMEFLEYACIPFASLFPSLKKSGFFSQFRSFLFSSTKDDDECHTSWKKQGLLLELISQGASELVLNCLLNKGYGGTEVDSAGKSLLHWAIERGYSFTVIAKILALFNDGEFHSQRDRRMETALDKAMRYKRYDVVNALVAKGAMRCQEKVVLEFYRDLPGLCVDSFKQLMLKNQTVEWLISLEELLPPLSKTGIQGSKIMGAHVLERSLPDDIKKQIFDENDKIMRFPGSTSRRNVARAKKLTVLKEHTLFFKEFPELPGLDHAIGSLIRRLVPFGAPYNELINYNGRPILVSQGMPGWTFEDAFKRDPQLLEKLDSENLSTLILLSFLVNPESDEPANIQVIPHPFLVDKYVLSMLDNDHAFVEAVDEREKRDVVYGSMPARALGFPLYEESRVKIGVKKSILYCLDFMDKAIDPAAIRRMSNPIVKGLLKHWIDELAIVDRAQRGLFSLPQQSTLFVDHESFIGIPIKRGEISCIVKVIERMTCLFELDSKTTHMMLLSSLSPTLANRYKSVLRIKKNPLKRFYELGEKFDQSEDESYKTDKSVTRKVKKSGRPIVESDGFPIIKHKAIDFIKAGDNIGPDGARRELEAIVGQPKTEFSGGIVQSQDDYRPQDDYYF